MWLKDLLVIITSLLATTTCTEMVLIILTVHYNKMVRAKGEFVTLGGRFPHELISHRTISRSKFYDNVKQNLRYHMVITMPLAQLLSQFNYHPPSPVNNLAQAIILNSVENPLVLHRKRRPTRIQNNNNRSCLEQLVVEEDTHPPGSFFKSSFRTNKARN